MWVRRQPRFITIGRSSVWSTTIPVHLLTLGNILSFSGLSLPVRLEGLDWMITPLPTEVSGPLQPLGSLEEQAHVSSQQCCPLGTEAAATPKLLAGAFAEPEAPGEWHPHRAEVGYVVLGPQK